MKRRAIELLLGRMVTDAEWLAASRLLDALESHPEGEAVMERCLERRLGVEETIAELSKLPPPE